MEQYVEGMEVATIASRTADDLLEELELSIMESSIRDQIQNGFNTSRDFLATVLNKFNAINEYADDDSARGIRSEMVDWANSLISAIVAQYDLGYNNLDSESLDVLDVLESLYHFFVLDRHNNVIEFYKQYIDMHKREIAEQMNLSAKNGDITTMANKKKNIHKDNIPILSNLDEVIQFVSSTAGVTTDELLEIIDDGDYHTAMVASYFSNGMLYGEIFQKYIDGEVASYTEDISMELRSAIRTYLSNV